MPARLAGDESVCLTVGPHCTFAANKSSASIQYGVICYVLGTGAARGNTVEFIMCSCERRSGGKTSFFIVLNCSSGRFPNMHDFQ